LKTAKSWNNKNEHTKFCTFFDHILLVLLLFGFNLPSI